MREHTPPLEKYSQRSRVLGRLAIMNAKAQRRTLMRREDEDV